MSTELVTIEEGAVFTPVFCDGDGDPVPEVSWWFRGAEVSLENTLDFTEPVTRWVNIYFRSVSIQRICGFCRSQTGEYTCHISNIHGMQKLSVNVDIQHKPSCEIPSSLFVDL